MTAVENGGGGTRGGFGREAAMSSIIPVVLVACASGPAFQGGDDAGESGRLARRVEAAFARARPTVVLVEGLDKRRPRPRWRRAGVIVTADGQLLCASAGEVDSVEVVLPDRRRAAARIVGRSGAWGVALLRLDGEGPWPHVPLDGRAGGEPGRAMMTLGFRLEGGGARATPDARVETVISAVPSSWFGATGGDASPGWLGEVAFDLDGALIGVGSTAYPGGQDDERFYAHAQAIRSVWDDLAGGRDADLRRLWPDGPRPGGIPPFDPHAPIPQAARDQAVAATVRIRAAADADEAEQSWSGVLVDEDGLIVTCAHHGKRPGTRLTIRLADGRAAAGRLIGCNPISDVGLARITGPGDWPHVDLGDSRRLAPGVPCFFVGYPGEIGAGLPPRVGVGVAAPPSHRIAPEGLCFLHARVTPPVTGGQSGGGLFDPDGHLAAISHAGNRLDGDLFARVELIRAGSRELAPGAYEERRGPPELAGAEAEVRRRAGSVKGSLVTILDGDEPVALGAIVTRDGGIVTRAGALGEAPSCRLADGRTEPAKVVRVSREDDVALLRIAAADLPAIEGWGSKDVPPIGQLLAIPNPDAMTVVGSVTCSLRSVMPAPKGGEFRHDRYPNVYEVGIPSTIKLSGGPVIDAMGRMRGVIVAVASDGWLIVVPSSSAQNALQD